jgi:hypothetical protein
MCESFNLVNVNRKLIINSSSHLIYLKRKGTKPRDIRTPYIPFASPFHLTELVCSPVNPIFFIKIYLQYVNTYTSIPDSIKIVPGQPIYLQNTRCARGTRRYLVRWWEVQQWKKLAQQEKHCSRRVRDQKRMCLGRLCRYLLYWWSKSGKV